MGLVERENKYREEQREEQEEEEEENSRNQPPSNAGSQGVRRKEGYREWKKVKAQRQTVAGEI